MVPYSFYPKGTLRMCCFVKVFIGTVVLSSSSGDFGPIKEQGVILPHVTTALRDFFLREKIVIQEINTDGLEW